MSGNFTGGKKASRASTALRRPSPWPRTSQRDAPAISAVATCTAHMCVVRARGACEGGATLQNPMHPSQSYARFFWKKGLFTFWRQPPPTLWCTSRPARERKVNVAIFRIFFMTHASFSLPVGPRVLNCARLKPYVPASLCQLPIPPGRLASPPALTGKLTLAAKLTLLQAKSRPKRAKKCNRPLI